MTIAERLQEHGRPYGGGVFAPPGSLDEALIEPLKTYKSRVAKRYRTLSPAQADWILPDGPLHVSPKIDGELWFALRHGNETVLCAPNGRMLAKIPVANALEHALSSVGDSLIAGELFVAPKEVGARPRVFHVAKALRDPGQSGRIGFKAFDVARFDGEDMLLRPYADRLAILESTLPASGPASPVKVVREDKREVMTRYREWVETKRYEGLVVRHDAGGTYKIKPEIGIDAVVIAWSDRLVLDRVELRELHVALLRDDGRFHLLGTVGSGLDNADRSRLQERLNALATESSYRMANREGTLCRFVRPELVIEIKCSDLMAADPGEPETLRMTLSFDRERGWQAEEPLPMPVMIAPVYLRERDDKRVDVSDVGLAQIRQITPFGDGDTTGPDGGIPGAAETRAGPGERSTVIHRRVWTKETKGRLAVRKYVAWATNKAERDLRYPAYVIAFTDFAAGRKQPLQRDLRVASSRDKLEEHIRIWEDKNLKRGWTEVPSA